MKITNLEELLADELKDIYSAESQILKALPQLAQVAESRDLHAFLENHLRQTWAHMQRIEDICHDLKIEPIGKTCAGMGGLIKECQEVIASDMASEAKQAALIGTAQRLEHYEVAAYGTARAHAKRLGFVKAFEVLTQTLNEENDTDQKLTQLAENRANVRAAMGSSEGAA